MRQAVTVKMLADHLGVDMTSVYKWRSGMNFPRLRMAIRIADYLHVKALRTMGSWELPCDHCGKIHEVAKIGGTSSRHFCSRICQERAARLRLNRRRRRTNQGYFRIVARESEDRRLAILENCLDCAGMGRLCPIIPTCTFLDVTELRKERRS